MVAIYSSSCGKYSANMDSIVGDMSYEYWRVIFAMDICGDYRPYI